MNLKCEKVEVDKSNKQFINHNYFETR